MASCRVQLQGEYAKNMYRCPAEWRRLIETRSGGVAPQRDERAESEFLNERIRRRLHVVEPRIDVKA
jgi:hypothetical protein